MPDDHVTTTDVLEHRSGHFTGEGAGSFRADVLGTHVYRRVFQNPYRIGQIHKGWKDGDVDRPIRFDAQFQFGEQRTVGAPRAVHFPITGHHRTTHRLDTLHHETLWAKGGAD